MRHICVLYLGSILALFAIAVAAASCSSGSGHGNRENTPPAGPFTAATEPAPAAIMTLLDQVAAVRQLLPPTTLKVGLVARSDASKLIDSLLTAQDRATMAQKTTLYRLLGLLAPDQDYLDVYRAFVGESLAGLYSPQQKALWIVHPDGTSTDFANVGGQEKQTLEHELVHAVQDANFNLSAMSDSTAGLDQALAATALVEGDAVSTQRNYDAKYAAIAAGGTVILARFDNLDAAAPPAFVREMTFPYTDGADWVDGIRGRGGDAAVDSLFKHPPDGTVYVFHPERISTGWTPQAVTLPPLAAVLGKGWTKQSGGQFGQFEVQNYLQLGLPGLQAVQGADGWAGDHYDTYTHGNDSMAAFRIVFGTASEAQRFAKAQDALLKAQGAATASVDGGMTSLSLSGGRTTVRLPADGPTVTFVVGSAPEIAKQAAAVLAHG